MLISFYLMLNIIIVNQRIKYCENSNKIQKGICLEILDIKTLRGEKLQVRLSLILYTLLAKV